MASRFMGSSPIVLARIWCELSRHEKLWITRPLAGFVSLLFWRYRTAVPPQWLWSLYIISGGCLAQGRYRHRAAVEQKVVGCGPDSDATENGSQPYLQI